MHGLIVGDTIRLYQRDTVFTWPPGEEHLVATETTNTTPEIALTASFSNGTLEHNDRGGGSVPSCAGLTRNQGEKKETEASTRWASNSRQTSTPGFEVCDTNCPVTKLEPLGVVIYGQFRRRYGLQHTAEKRLAAMVGSAVEHAQSAAVLRLFARMLGVQAGTKPGGDYRLKIFHKAGGSSTR